MEKFFRAKFSPNHIEAFGDFTVSLGNKSCNVWVDWVWDGKKLTLINDRYGYFPIYYYVAKNEIAVSSSIHKLLEFVDHIELDEDAFSLFLRLGSLIGEDTIFKGIRAVPPACTLTWQNGELKIDSKGIIQSKPIEISRREAMKQYVGLFQKSIEKTIPANERIIVPLSGGRDSRHIALALCKAGRQPDACATILHPPPRANEDARIAIQVCSQLNLTHLLLEQKRPRVEAEIEKNKRFGYSVYEHAWFLSLADVLAEEPHAVYDGIAGDVLSAGHFLTDKRLQLFRQEKFEELANDIMDDEGYLPKLLTSDLYRIYNRDRAVAHFIKELKRHANQPNPVGSLYIYNRTRRCIAASPFRLLGETTTVVMPYMETEVYDFLSSIPAEMFLDHQFHTETIIYAFPECAHIPFELKTAPLNFDTKYFRAYIRDIYNYSRTSKNRQLTSTMFFLFRYLRSLVNANYSKRVPDFGEQTVHLLQLERL